MNISSRDRVLQILLQSKGSYVSGEKIATRIGVSRNAVWKAIAKLKEQGINVVSYKKLGYMIPIDSNFISKEEILANVLEPLKASETYVFNSITSTNDYAKELAKKGAPEYTLVVSDTQTQGKGRMGRAFVSPAGTGVYMSIVLRPKTSMETSQLITSCVAVAISKAIDALCGSTSKIKWVNDVLIGGKKVSGTLTEGALDFETNSFSYAVVGIGINVRSVKGVFDEELSSIASSIEDETGVPVSRSRLIAEVYNRVYLEMQHIEDGSFLEEYRERSMIVGENVIVSENGVDTNAKAVAIDRSAGLVVQFADGSVKVLNSGEARIRKY